MDLALANASTLVSDADSRTIARALDAQLREDVLPDWDRRPCSCIWLAGGTSANVPAGVLPIYLFDSPDQPGVFGYHDETPEGFLSGKVFAKAVLDAGGGILDGGKIGDSVSAVASHEAIEAKFDPNVNLWADCPRGIYVGGKRFVSASYELCDPVQDGTYEKEGALVSNYVLRAWFDPSNARGPFDRLRVLTASFSLTPGGYAIVRDAAGNESSEFAAATNPRPWRTVGRRRGAARAAAAKFA